MTAGKRCPVESAGLLCLVERERSSGLERGSTPHATNPRHDGPAVHDFPRGYNAATEVSEDMVKAGVIDPTKVTRTALQNAASISGLLLTTECVVVEEPEKEPAMPMGGGGGGMGDMY